LELDHSFSVPADVETTWAHFEDIASVAECFPGAAVTSVEGDTFQGTCKVKLGPIALVYGGSGTFTEKDEDAHRFVVDAKGKDKRGNGTAGATVTLAMASSASGGTDVSVHTDLAITGKPAQFGRGVMQDVSDKLLGQFVACLEQRLGEGAAAPAGGPPATAGAASSEAEAAATSVPASADEADVAASAPGQAAVGTPAPTSTPTPVPAPSPAPAPAPARSMPAAKQDDALDLGATVLPILARTYWKQGVALLLVIAIVVWLLVR
jgi:carbon monoxide dehydrogenase subunit G